jgi:hypothetical protein
MFTTQAGGKKLILRMGRGLSSPRIYERSFVSVAPV